MPYEPALPTYHKRERFLEALKDNVALLLGFVAVFWGLEILDTILFGALDRFGVQPRRIGALTGIATAPFLHAGFGHLVSNTLPFLVLGGIVLIGGRKVFLSATVIIIVLAGAALWLLGPARTNHIGASILIFGYLGFLLTRGAVERSPFWIVVSLVVLVLYGGMMAGVLPGQRFISWQGHLFGFLAGVFAAWIMFSGAKQSSNPQFS